MMGWSNAWNYILRKAIFPDHELRTLMKVPPKINILQFIDRYFIHAGYANSALTDEVCRIIYSEERGSDTEVPNVKKKIMMFDIYVKDAELHNIGDDRLVFRTHLIAARLRKLLTSERYCKDTGYRFWIADEWDLGTRVIGYSRHCIAFYFMKVY